MPAIVGLGCTPKITLSDNDPIDPNQGQAKLLNYVHDAFEAGRVPKNPPKNLEKKPTKVCANCKYFVKDKDLQKADSPEGKWGRCQILSQGLVNASGQCDSWQIAEKSPL